MLRLPPGEQRLEWRSLSPRIPRGADTVQDNGLLQLRFFVGDFETSQGGDDGFTFFEAVASKEPARGFGEPDDADADDEGEDDLEGDGETPGKVCGAAVGF